MVDAAIKDCYHPIAMTDQRPPFFSRIGKSIQQLILWFSPGLGVKRWLGLILLGTTMLAVGLAFILLDFYRQAPDNWISTVLAILSLQALPRLLRALIFGSIGVGFVLVR